MTAKRHRILVVDDEPDIRQLIGQLLEDDNYLVTEVHDAAAARTAVRMEKFDAILLDIWMPGVDGITLLKEWQDAQLGVPVVMMSAHGSIETAVEATQHGALDFLEKPFSSGRLSVTVRNAVARRESAADGKSGGIAEKPSAKTALIGFSAPMKRLREQVRNIVATGCKVMIVGEAGSGKKFTARYIHESRFSADAPFVTLNWLADPPARYAAAAALEAARGGTLLIPSVEAHDGYSQVRLLGLLNDIGALALAQPDAAPTVIATAGADIKSHVATGALRSDIFQILNELTVEVPPLRERAEDIPELVGYLGDQFSQDENLPYKRFSTAALNALRNHSWDGNIQELKNVVYQMLLHGSEEMISGIDIETQIAKTSVTPVFAAAAAPAANADTEHRLTFRDARNEFERRYLLNNLKACSTFTEMASRTGLHRSSLFRKLKEHSIDILPSGESEKLAQEKVK